MSEKIDPTQYTILRDDTPWGLEKKVRQAIEMGMQPLGGVALSVAADEDHNHIEYWAQAMLPKEQPIDQPAADTTTARPMFSEPEGYKPLVNPAQLMDLAQRQMLRDVYVARALDPQSRLLSPTVLPVRELRNCSRCGHVHQNLIFVPMDEPMVVEGEAYNWWSLCPESVLPILMRHQNPGDYQSPVFFDQIKDIRTARMGSA